MTTLYSWLITLVLLGGISFGAWYYYTTSEATMEEQAIQIVQLQESVRTSEETIAILTEERDATVVALRNEKIRSRVAEQYQDELLRILHKHDLTNLVSKKPGLTGKAINEGTYKVFRDIESLTSDKPE